MWEGWSIYCLYRNPELLKHFMDPHTKDVLHTYHTKVCQHVQKRIVTQVELAKLHGTLTFDLSEFSSSVHEWNKTQFKFILKTVFFLKKKRSRKGFFEITETQCLHKKVFFAKTWFFLEKTLFVFFIIFWWKSKWKYQKTKFYQLKLYFLKVSTAYRETSVAIMWGTLTFDLGEFSSVHESNSSVPKFSFWWNPVFSKVFDQKKKPTTYPSIATPCATNPNNILGRTK